jgi:hypothetical protein
VHRVAPALVALALLLNGCALLLTGDHVSDDERAQINDETAPYLQKGSGTITGTVRLDTDYGVFVAGRNTEVVLTPATTIAQRRFEEDIVADYEMPASRKAELVLFARTDAAGRLRFESLPPGQYLIASPVRWSPTGRGDDAYFDVPHARVTLADGEHADVVVTRAVERD